MIKSRIAAGAALLAVAGVASAGSFSVTPTIASDYDWRGISQTDPEQDGDVAFQLGGTYSFDNGFYVGAWGSNVDFGASKPDFELDAFAGYAGSTDLFGYDVGVNFYNYPGESDLNFMEAYAGISKDWASAKLWFSPEFGGNSDDSAFYLEGNVAYPMPQNFSLLAHVGYSFGDYFSGGNKYVDYSIGAGYSFSNLDLAVKYVDNDISGLNRGAVVASISTTFPWGE